MSNVIKVFNNKGAVKKKKDINVIDNSETSNINFNMMKNASKRPIVNKRPVGPIVNKRPVGPVVNKRPVGPVVNKRPVGPVVNKRPVGPVVNKSNKRPNVTNVNKSNKRPNVTNVNKSNKRPNVTNVNKNPNVDNKTMIPVLNSLYLNKLDKFCEIMNVTQKDVLTDPKQEFRYLCYKYTDYIRMLKLPIISKYSFYESILIEFRCLPHLEFLIRNSIYKLGVKWSQTIVCGSSNYKFICNIVKNIDRDIKIIMLNHENITQLEYNNLLLIRKFWEMFNGEKLLIYQEDSCIFKNNIDDFLEWDYIGAPWPKEYNINKNGVGNGGFSLRSKSVILECFKYDEKNLDISPVVYKYMNDNNLPKLPEDVFFTNIMEYNNIGKLADWETGKKFSSESFHEDSLGGHQFWLNNKNWKNYLYPNVIKTFIPRHFSDFDHRGGWNNVIKHLYELNIYNTNSEIVFYDLVEKDFIWEKTELNKKWFGIVHCTENTPPYLDCVNTSNLFKPNSHFLKNIDKCLFLIGLSPNVVSYLKKKLSNVNINVNVYLLNHPIDTEENIPMFSINKFVNNDNKKIIQIGQQLRKVTSIYRLKIDNDYKKLWLTGTKDFDKLKKLFIQESAYLRIKNININDVEMKYTDTFVEYDNLLVKNIVFIDLFDAAANNTILECILRRTPIIINRLPATVYYLGEDYPLFFDNIDEVSNLLTKENITNAHEYLKTIKLTSIKEFTSNILNILNVNFK
jgi:hypothetical protein